MAGVEYTKGTHDDAIVKFVRDYRAVYDDEFINSMHTRTVKGQQLTVNMIRALNDMRSDWMGVEVEQMRKMRIGGVLGVLNNITLLLNTRERSFVQSLTEWVRTRRATPRQASYLKRIAHAHVSSFPDQTIIAFPSGVGDVKDANDMRRKQKAREGGDDDTHANARTMLTDADFEELQAFERELKDDTFNGQMKRAQARETLGDDFYKCVLTSAPDNTVRMVAIGVIQSNSCLHINGRRT